MVSYTAESLKKQLAELVLILVVVDDGLVLTIIQMINFNNLS